MMASAPVLIVPVDLVALPVGVDAPKRADIALRFDIEVEPHTPWVGQSTEPRPFARSTSFQPGVHLHWLLPPPLTTGQLVYTVTTAVADGIVSSALANDPVSAAALRAVVGAQAGTREALARTVRDLLSSKAVPASASSSLAARAAEAATARTTFPAVPNRWRVARWLGEPDGPPTRTWVIESDHLWDTLPAGDACAAQNRLSPTIPAGTRPRDGEGDGDGEWDWDGPPYHRRLGRVFPGDRWSEGSAERHRPFTALGYGHPAFAAALPHCYNVFGFWDPLDDVPTANNSAVVSYAVEGWWSDGTVPPGFAEAAAAKAVARGALTGITWTRASTPTPTAHPAAVAVGTSTASAAAVALARQPGFADPAVERPLEVLQLGLAARLDDRRPGTLEEWDDALHAGDFAAEPGGTRWTIGSAGSADAVDVAGTIGSADRAAPDLPGPVVDLLDALNAAQYEADARQRDLDWQRDQLFADWVSMAIASSAPPVGPPGPDPLAALQQSIRAIEAAARDLNAALVTRDQRRVALDAALATSSSGPPLSLHRVGAPPFWRPADPVVLLWGDGVRPPARSTQAAVVAHVDDTSSPWLGGAWDVASAARRWSPPWRPLLLEWEATFQAALSAAAGPVDRQLSPRALLDGFIPDPDDPSDLVATGSPVEGTVCQLHGMVPLGGRPLTNLAEQARLYARTYPAADDDIAGQRSEQDLLGLASHLDGKAADGKAADGKAADGKAADGKAADGKAAEGKAGDEVAPPIQSQALSGLHAALVGRTHSIELPVLDPRATSRQRDFVTKLAAAVGHRRASGVLSAAAFHPLRAGHLRISRLWVLDSFGQVLPVMGPPAEEVDLQNPHLLPPDAIIRSERLATASDPLGVCTLRPRLSQSARLGFVWTSSTAPGPAAQMSVRAPVTDPVFGWILAHHLDDALGVYDSNGRPVGVLSMDGPLWSSTPGPDHERSIEEVVPEGELRQFLIGVVGNNRSDPGRAHLRSLIDAVDDMTRYVVPTAHAQDRGLAVLIGRPLALARAALWLELAGRPAVDQRRAAFADFLARRPRSDGGLTSLLVPVHLGHRARLDDGLIGYFIERATAADTYRTFLVEDPELPEGAAARHPARDELVVSASADPQVVTLVLDPRAPVHATTAILPRTAIALPPERYQRAIDAMSVTFPVGPILTTRAHPAVMMPLPPEAHATWRFVSRRRDRWSEEPVTAPASAPDGFPSLQELRDGWIRLVRGEEERGEEQRGEEQRGEEEKPSAH